MTYNEARALADKIADEMTEGSKKCVITVSALSELTEFDGLTHSQSWHAVFYCETCGQAVMAQIHPNIHSL